MSLDLETALVIFICIPIGIYAASQARDIYKTLMKDLFRKPRDNPRDRR